MANEIPTVGGDENVWGTVLNNYMQKGQGWLDIRAFLPSDFVTDGSVDYTTEIQAAVDADPPVLFIPEGTWACNLSIDGKVNVVGTGPESKLKAETSSPVITVTERITGLALGRRFQDFTVDGNSKTSIGILYTALTVEEDTFGVVFQSCTRGIDWGTLGAIGNNVRHCNFINCDYGIYAKDSGVSATALNLNSFTENRFRTIALCGIYLNGSVVGCSGNGFNDNWMEGITGFGVILRGLTVIDAVTYPNHFRGGWYEDVAATTPIVLDDEGSQTSYVIWIENCNAVSSNGIFPSDVLIDGGILSIDYYKGTGPIADKGQIVSSGTAEVSIEDAFIDVGGTGGLIGSSTGSLIVKRPHCKGNDNRGFLVESHPAINNTTSHTNLTSIADLTAVSGASLTYQSSKFLNSTVRRIELSDATETADSATLVLTDDKHYAISFSVKAATSTEEDITLIGTGTGIFLGSVTFTARADRWTHYIGAVYAGTGGGFPTGQTFRFGTGTSATFDISKFQLVEFDTIIEAESFVHNQGFAETTVQTLTGAGEVNIVEPITHLVTAGIGDAITLEDGYEGQEKVIVYKTETTPGHTSILTPSNFLDGATITYDVADQWSKLLFTNGSWRIIINDGTVG